MNEKKVLIGLDLGTTNAKAIAYTPSGEFVHEACCTYPTYYPQTGWSEQNPHDWQNALKETLSQLSIVLRKQGWMPIGMGLSAHAPGIILTDACGQPLAETFPIWQDARSIPQSQQLYRDLGTDWVGLGYPGAAFGAKLLWFIQEKSDLAAKARYALGVKGFLIHWLTGNFATDPSSEPGNEPVWQALCQYCRWTLKKLPQIISPTDIAGAIRDELADETGLPHNLPVIMGINDGGSATLANGAVMNGDCVIQLATNGVVYMATPTPIPSDVRYKHAIFCWRYIEDYWIAGGQTKCGAANLQWLTKIINGENQKSTYELLLDEAALSTTGSRGIIFLPYLMGRGTPNDNSLTRGGFYGLGLSTKRGDMCRAVLEGVAFSIKEIFDDFSQLGCTPRQVFITGGGARNELWRQIMANVLGRDVIYSAADLCLGNAILAAVGLGVYSDMQAAVKGMTCQVASIQPENEAVLKYKEIFIEYKNIANILPTATPKILESE